jgi:hypothetical protein
MADLTGSKGINARTRVPQFFEGLTGILSDCSSLRRSTNVAQPPDNRSPVAIAFEWSATVMTISAEMVVPGLLGYWLDQRLGTRALFLLLGFSGGGALAALSLGKIAKRRTDSGGEQRDGGESTKNDLE